MCRVDVEIMKHLLAQVTIPGKGDPVKSESEFAACT
jgi:hypothetical protein